MGTADTGARSAPAGLFVGRDKELSELHAALRRTAAGQSAMLLVAGEAGVGKTRLAGQFAEQARRAGTLVGLGGAAPLTGGAVAYAPLVQALRVLADDHEPAGLREIGAELAGVLAELTGNQSAGERAWAPELGRGRLFDRLCRLFGGLGRSAPLLLVLEDLHWADSATLDVLAFVLRTVRGARLLVVGTYRADYPADLLAGWLAEMRRLPGVCWLELLRFTRPELAAQLAGLRGGPVDSQVVTEVFDRSRGNPFFAEQLFAIGSGVGDLPLPGLLRDVLLAQVRQLSPGGQHLVQVAAVAGRWVCHNWLAAVAGTPDEQLDSGLAEAVGRGLLLVTPMERAGPEVYEFRHALLQEAVYGELLPGQRARLHSAYAHAIVNAPTARQAASHYAAELAEHWYQAGQPGEALAWAVRAADNAERVYAHAEAARHCDRAAALWEQVADAADRAGADRAGLHRRAARAWEYAGDETRARAHVEQALRHVDPAANPVRAGLLHNLRSWYAAGTTDLDLALTANREAVRLVPAEPPSTARAHVLIGYGRTLHLQAARYDEATAVHEQALTAARQAGSQPDTARALALLGYMRAVSGHVDAGVALLREACALAGRPVGAAGRTAPEEFGGHDAEWRVAAGVELLFSDVLLKTNRLQEAAHLAVRGWELMRRLGLADHRNGCNLLSCAVEALFGLGRWDQAAQLSEPLADQPVSYANTILQVRLAELEAARGQPEAALARLDQVRERGWRQSPERARELGQRRAEVLLWLGRPQPALAEVTQALDAVSGTGQERFAGWLACLGARALADLAEQARARQDPAAAASVQQRGRLLAQQVTELTDNPFACGIFMPTSAGAEKAHWDAELTRLSGTADPGAWQAAIDAWQQLGLGYRAAYAQWRQAEALLACGAGPGRAADPLRAGHATTMRLGAAPLRAEIEALDRRARISLAPAQSAPSPAPAHPHGLTDREAVVLRLLAAGHTNRQIGQQLFISPKTASVHVTSILRKLAVHDRVQAAAVAVRLGLVNPPVPGSGSED